MHELTPDSQETARLLEEVRQGDCQALGRLLERHRDDLHSFVAVRFDARLAGLASTSGEVWRPAPTATMRHKTRGKKKASTRAGLPDLFPGVLSRALALPGGDPCCPSRPTGTIPGRSAQSGPSHGQDWMSRNQPVPVSMLTNWTGLRLMKR
jgi:hypothetical protein